MKVKLKKAKGKPGQEALVGDGHGREVISGASDWETSQRKVWKVISHVTHG